jgi:hypothetical protein
VDSQYESRIWFVLEWSPDDRAHCFSYELVHGVDSLGDEECNHKCDNRICVNEAHLFKGTREEGVQDKVAKGRQAKGENSRQSDLRKIHIKAIRSLRALGDTHGVLAKQFNVSGNAIWKIINRKTWRHVKG